jgi:aspartyl-tRNA(Asn)/glutamyl-tRNA(Gln) amidotransferase subunit C
MKLTEKDVRHIAKLAAIEVSDQEVEELQGELSDILEYVNKLSELDTSSVTPMSHIHGVVNAFRDDVVKDSLSVEEVQKNAPDFIGDGFKVPRIL